MRRGKWLFLLLMVVIGLTACSYIAENTIRGSGDIQTIERDLSGFDRLDISHSFDVEVEQGDAFSVIIRVDDNVEEYLDVRRNGDTLLLGLDPEPFTLNRVTLEADVVMPKLVGVELSGASSLHLHDFSISDDFEADISGSSDLSGELDAVDVDIEASGSSKVTLDGSAETLRADASGASQLKMANFEVVDATVGASGASDVEVWATGELDAEASGASDIVYKGDPGVVNADTSGAASVEPD